MGDDNSTANSRPENSCIHHEFFVIANIGDFGSIVRRFRTEHRLTQQELAELSNTSRTWLTAVETGRNKVTLERAAKLLVPLQAQLAVVRSADPLDYGAHPDFDPPHPGW